MSKNGVDSDRAGAGCSSLKSSPARACSGSETKIFSSSTSTSTTTTTTRCRTTRVVPAAKAPAKVNSGNGTNAGNTSITKKTTDTVGCRSVPSAAAAATSTAGRNPSSVPRSASATPSVQRPALRARSLSKTRPPVSPSGGAVSSPTAAPVCATAASIRHYKCPTTNAPVKTTRARTSSVSSATSASGPSRETTSVVGRTKSKERIVPIRVEGATPKRSSRLPPSLPSSACPSPAVGRKMKQTIMSTSLTKSESLEERVTRTIAPSSQGSNFQKIGFRPPSLTSLTAKRTEVKNVPAEIISSQKRPGPPKRVPPPPPQTPPPPPPLPPKVSPPSPQKTPLVSDVGSTREETKEEYVEKETVENETLELKNSVEQPEVQGREEMRTEKSEKRCEMISRDGLTRRSVMTTVERFERLVASRRQFCSSFDIRPPFFMGRDSSADDVAKEATSSVQPCVPSERLLRHDFLRRNFFRPSNESVSSASRVIDAVKRLERCVYTSTSSSSLGPELDQNSQFSDQKPFFESERGQSKDETGSGAKPTAAAERLDTLISGMDARRVEPNYWRPWAAGWVKYRDAVTRNMLAPSTSSASSMTTTVTDHPMSCSWVSTPCLLTRASDIDVDVEVVPSTVGDPAGSEQSLVDINAQARHPPASLSDPASGPVDRLERKIRELQGKTERIIHVHSPERDSDDFNQTEYQVEHPESSPEPDSVQPPRATLGEWRHSDLATPSGEVRMIPFKVEQPDGEASSRRSLFRSGISHVSRSPVTEIHELQRRKERIFKFEPVPSAADAATSGIEFEFCSGRSDERSEGSSTSERKSVKISDGNELSSPEGSFSFSETLDTELHGDLDGKTFDLVAGGKREKLARHVPGNSREETVARIGSYDASNTSVLERLEQKIRAAKDRREKLLDAPTSSKDDPSLSATLDLQLARSSSSLLLNKPDSDAVASVGDASASTDDEDHNNLTSNRHLHKSDSGVLCVMENVETLSSRSSCSSDAGGSSTAMSNCSGSDDGGEETPGNRDEKIFFRAGVLSQLESLRDERIQGRIVMLQAYCRGCLARRRLAKRRVEDVAIRCIQKNVSKYLAVRSWPWWRLYTKVAPLLNVHRTEEELRSRTEEVETLRAKLEKAEKERSQLKSANDRLEARLSELTADLAEEHSTSTLAAEKLEAETAERMRLQQEFGRLQGEFKSLEKSRDKLETELMYSRATSAAAQMNGDAGDEDGVEDASVYKVRYERAMREMDHVKQRLMSKHEEDVEQLINVKKNLEKRLHDAQEETEEQRQVVSQWKRKVTRLQGELADLKHLHEEQTGRNNILEKRQRKFDAELQSAQDEVKAERREKERVQRERDLALADKYALEQSLQTLKMDFEVKDERVQSLMKELDDVSSSSTGDNEITALKRVKHDLELRIKEQDEELDDLSGQAQLWEAAKTRLEMSLEQMRKEHRKEIAQLTEEMEEIRANAQKKVRALEAQLETEHEERTQLMRDKHELERKLTELHTTGIATKAEQSKIQALKRELKKTRALLQDAQTALDRAQDNNPSRVIIRQLKNQLEDLEFAKMAAVKARQVAEAESRDLQSQMEEMSRSKSDVEQRIVNLQREKNSLLSQLEDHEDELKEVMRKFKAAVQQSSVDQSVMVDQANQIAQLEQERANLRDHLSDLTAKLDAMAGEEVHALEAKKLAAKIRQLEGRFELEQSTKTRLEAMITKLKEQVEALTQDLENSRVREQTAQEAQKRAVRQLRDAQDEYATLQLRETEALSKKEALEQHLDQYETENLTLKSDLTLALKRIEDLQAAMQEGHDDSDSDLGSNRLGSSAEDDDDESESDVSGGTFLSVSRNRDDDDRLKRSRHSSQSTSATNDDEADRSLRIEEERFALSPSHASNKSGGISLLNSPTGAGGGGSHESEV